MSINLRGTTIKKRTNDAPSINKSVDILSSAVKLYKQLYRKRPY